MTTITLEGGKELAAALRNASKDMVAAVEEAVTKTGFSLQGNVKKRILRGPKTGAVYYFIFDPETGYTTTYANDTEGFVRAEKGDSSRPSHQSSAAGESPATDTGRLAGSIIFEQVGPGSVTVGSDLVYAAYLEYGTISMSPRPAWRPAIEEETPKFRNRLLGALGMALD
jgi:HK97 gp10 family phage protein